MLLELKVNHFAIIDKLHIQFNRGFNVLSGETGAGKSLLIKSLSLLMGAKSSNQDIRPGQKKASIEGVFNLTHRKDLVRKLKELDLEGDQPNEESLVIRRLLERNGKSRVHINGHLCTLSDLRRIVFPMENAMDHGHSGFGEKTGESSGRVNQTKTIPLIELTGQHESKDLLSSRYQMDILDQFCKHFDLRKKVTESFYRISKKVQEIEELKNLSGQREQHIDFLNFQIKEIEDMNLQKNEDQILLEKIKNIKNKRQWQSWIQKSIDLLNNQDTAVLSQLKIILNQTPEDPSLKEIKDQITQGFIQLEDAAFSLQQISDDSPESEDETLTLLEERLSRLRKIQKKFGSELSDIFKKLEEMKTECQKLNQLSETLEKLEEEYGLERQKFLKLCEKLRKKRQEGAGRLSQQVNRELKDLNMMGVEFSVALLEQTETSTGIDRVVFQIQSGKRDQKRELARSASGGELSRILLALKQVEGSREQPRTFLFDEVDSGVSGPTAEKVGAKLKSLARHQQVICITHLPQVARFADHHFLIKKTLNKDTVSMSVTCLNQKQRILEIARLISGEKQGQTSLDHAKELLLN